MGRGYVWQMEHIGLISAIFLGNMLTATFAWGMWRARNIYNDRDLDKTTFLALVLPPIVAFAGFYLST